MKQVAVIIPMYKTDLSKEENLSLKQTYTQFRDYTIIVVHPEGLDMDVIKKDYPRMQYMAFPKTFFEGIEGYNRFMMSKDLYGAFVEDYEYILICQTDVYIFKGSELSVWCGKGYDYIGAPWIKRSCYDLPLMKQWQQFQQWRNHRKGKIGRQDFWNKVGNGGLSLRKVRTFYDATIRYADKIQTIFEGDRYVAEDIFWGTMVEGFRYPDWKEALGFAFDKDPDYCYYVQKGELPFGCHAWFRGKSARFWLPMLGLAPKTKDYTRYPIKR